jgi:hypothetical protein
MTGKLDCMPASPELAMAGRPLVHFTLNVFIVGLGLNGKRSLSSFRTSIPHFGLFAPSRLLPNLLFFIAIILRPTI